MAIGVSAQSAVQPIAPNGTTKIPNTEQAYTALRADLPEVEGVTVKDFTLEREGATFHFDRGAFYFYAPVEGQVTGAVFVGTGRFDLAVTDERNLHSIAQLTNGGAGTLETAFSTVVLRFTDETAKAIRAASTGTADAPGASVHAAAEDLAQGFRRNLNENLDVRLLADVLGGEPGGFFLASFHMGGTPMGRNVLFVVDPRGTFHAAPDEVELSTWNDLMVQPWVAYRMHRTAADVGRSIQVFDETLDMTIGSTGKITASAETSVKMRRDGVRVLRLNLYPTLRVSGVYGEDGAPLDFVQEPSDSDADYAVILPAAAKAGQTVRVLTVYSGAGVVIADGDETYHIASAAKDSWYPSGQGWMGDSTNFHTTFHIPKGLQIVATGKQVELTPEGEGTKAVWQTDAPVSSAGFDLGELKSMQLKTLEGYEVDAYANVNLPSAYMPLQEGGTMGNMSTLPDLKDQLARGAAAFQVYASYFGRLPYDHVALTQQSSCSYGVNWPMMVGIPICGFWREGLQHRLGLLDYDKSYWSEVGLHEVAHQWWGGLIGFNDYRDQWMSVGFSNFSVGEYLRTESMHMGTFRAFWRSQQENLLQKDPQGLRPIDAGPLTSGMRVLHSKDGDDLHHTMIYSKGAFILHMLDMLYWTPQDKEETFKRSMRAFVAEYAGKEATTEDFKASMEKTMPKWMDLRGDGKLDWFFDEYVYGTELPHYAVSSQFTTDANGVVSVHVKLTQSNVTNKFVMLMPLYLELKDGQTNWIANVVLHGDSTIEEDLKLGKLPAKTIVLNYYSDVLCDE